MDSPPQSCQVLGFSWSSKAFFKRVPSPCYPCLMLTRGTRLDKILVLNLPCRYRSMALLISQFTLAFGDSSISLADWSTPSWGDYLPLLFAWFIFTFRQFLGFALCLVHPHFWTVPNFALSLGLVNPCFCGLDFCCSPPWIVAALYAQVFIRASWDPQSSPF